MSRRPAAGAVLAGVAATAAAAALDRHPPGGRPRWTRTNFRDREVDLLGGPAAAAGVVVSAAAIAASGDPGPLVLTVTATGLGLYDDLFGEGHARGLRGHLRALRSGRVTTGLVKMVGLTAAGVVAATLRHRRTPDGVGWVLADAALIAGTANLVNLLDLRPGRALKAVILVSLPLVQSGDSAAVAAAGTLATAAVTLPGDLAERHMLGDCGANGLGALAGWALAAHGGHRARAGALAGVVALTLVSERVSFSRVIDGQPLLRRLDAWGRRR